MFTILENKSAIIRAIKNAKSVYCHVQITDNDGCYVKVTKEEILNKIEGFSEGEKFNVQVFTDTRGYKFDTTNYIDPHSGNECEVFHVYDDRGKKVYERDYGSVGGGYTEYVEDYLSCLKRGHGIDYRGIVRVN